jgi:hypothetical protein
MAFPTAELPHQELGFVLGDHRLTAVAETRDRGQSLTFDLFADGRSLSGGPSLDATRLAAPTPSHAYPMSFQIIDRLLLIAPAAAAPGFSIGVLGNADRIGLPSAAAIIAVGLVAIGIATGIARIAWKWVASNDYLGIGMRTLYGGLALAAIYTIAFIAMIGIWVALIGQSHAP